MKPRKLAGRQLQMTVAKIFPEAVDLPLGIVLSAEPVREHQTDEQRAGFHWLLSEWIAIDPDVARGAEDLKTRVLIAKFGAAKVTDSHGNEAFIPVRRTTQIWDWDAPGYKRKLLSRALYVELIDLTYKLAAEDGVILPEMEPDVLKRMSQRRPKARSEQ